MPGFRHAVLLAALLCAAGAGARQPEPVVRDRAGFEARLAAAATPLDSLTPFGRREFIRSLRWGERGLASFSLRVPERELMPQQVRELLTFLGAAAYLPERLPATPPLRFPAPQPELERAWHELQALSDAASAEQDDAGGHASVQSPARPLAYYRAHFSAFMPAPALAAVSTGDLALLFDASALLAERFADSAAMRDLAGVYRELQRRAVDTRRGFDRTVLRRLLAQQEFDAARAFAAAHPDLAAIDIPDVSDALAADFSGRSVLEQHGSGWQRVPLPTPRGTQVIGVFGTGCHYSRDALHAIAGDFALRQALERADLLLLTAPGEAEPYRFVSEWNAGHPDLPLRIPARRSEWSAVDQPSVPRFYVFRDGQLRNTVIGWPPGGNGAALRAALEQFEQ